MPKIEGVAEGAHEHNWFPVEYTTDPITRKINAALYEDGKYHFRAIFKALPLHQRSFPGAQNATSRRSVDEVAHVLRSIASKSLPA